MGFLNKLFGKKESSLITFKDPKKHPHYYAVGPNGLPNCWKPYFNPEPQEYLVITADAEIVSSEMDMPFCANVDILGYINLTTGERRDTLSFFTFIPTDEEKKNQSYKNRYDKFTVYKIKALTTKEPNTHIKVLTEEKIIFSTFSDIFCLETLEKRLSNDFLESLIEEYKKPEIVNFEEFGDFTLNKSEYVLEGKYNWLGNAIDLSVEYPNEEETHKFLKTFDSLCKDQKSFDENARRFAAKFLTTYINKWRSNGSITYYANMLSEEDIAKMLQIGSVYIDYDIEYEIRFKDHPYFCGRKITVYYKLKTKEPDHLEIEEPDGTITDIDSDGYTLNF
ncbi:MAG: DUF2262 domain-containing protein [Butyrivibrio sp.]|nr:DUF2262 domain-containing protein [Butyrivibrio sp.]